jgi:hypothetical protein
MAGVTVARNYLPQPDDGPAIRITEGVERVADG